MLEPESAPSTAEAWVGCHPHPAPQGPQHTGGGKKEATSNISPEPAGAEMRTPGEHPGRGCPPRGLEAFLQGPVKRNRYRWDWPDSQRFFSGRLVGGPPPWLPSPLPGGDRKQEVKGLSCIPLGFLPTIRVVKKEIKNTAGYHSETARRRDYLPGPQKPNLRGLSIQSQELGGRETARKCQHPSPSSAPNPQ